MKCPLCNHHIVCEGQKNTPSYECWVCGYVAPEMGLAAHLCHHLIASHPKYIRSKDDHRFKCICGVVTGKGKMIKHISDVVCQEGLAIHFANSILQGKRINDIEYYESIRHSGMLDLTIKVKETP